MMAAVWDHVWNEEEGELVKKERKMWAETLRETDEGDQVATGSRTALDLSIPGPVHLKA